MLFSSRRGGLVPWALCVSAFSLLLGACGGPPPSSLVNKEIEKDILSANTVAYDGGEKGAEVTSIKLKGWKKTEGSGSQGFPDHYTTEWTAKLRFKEPLAVIEAEVDGKKIVRVVAKKGDDIEFTGSAYGAKLEGKWDVGANANIGFLDAGPWKKIEDAAGGVSRAYQSTNNGVTRTVMGPAFYPLSSLKPYVEVGSDEYKKMVAELAEKQRAAQEAAMAQAKRRQEELEAQRKQQQEEYDARQKQQQEAYAEQQRKQQEAYAEQQRKQQEEQKRLAEAARVTKLTPLIKPFQSATGLVITSDAGQAMGSVITEATADAEKFAVSGKGIDLREMPFKEFTFEGATEERGVITLQFSNASAPMAYSAQGANLLGANRTTATPLSEADRAKLNATIALGKRLQGASPLTLNVEVLDAATAKTREAGLAASNMPGVCLYQNRRNDQVGAMFTTTANGRYRWSKEPICLRLNEVMKGKGIYLKNGGAPTDNLGVVINGVHRVTIPLIEKYGAASITIPTDLEVLDLRLEAGGTAYIRGAVMLNP